MNRLWAIIFTLVTILGVNYYISAQKYKNLYLQEKEKLEHMISVARGHRYAVEELRELGGRLIEENIRSRAYSESLEVYASKLEEVIEDIKTRPIHINVNDSIIYRKIHIIEYATPNKPNFNLKQGIPPILCGLNQNVSDSLQ